MNPRLWATGSLSIAVLCTAVMLALPASAQQKTDFEPAPLLRAAELVAAGILKGPHRVGDPVQVESFLGQF